MDKRDGLTQQFRECPVLFACRGECPKSRFATNERGEGHHQYLCEGYYAFFTHIGPAMRTMTTLLRSGRPAADIMQH